MSRWEPIQHVLQRVVSWVGERRTRMFGSAAVVLFLLAGMLPLFGSMVLNLTAGLIALLAAANALVAVLTWLAERRGATDAGDMWDHERHESRPDDVFRGFSGFSADQ